jgi:methylenetetrahydrofolate reductase (NADPH)
MTADSNAAIRRVLENPLCEVIPVDDILDQVGNLPTGATVSVTASPRKGMAATIDLAVRLSDLGFEVVPHLSARLLSGRAELAAILDRLDRADVTQVLVVGGDGERSGPFPDGFSLLIAMKELGHRLTGVGIPAYPEGHPNIPVDRLDAALLAKQPLADSMTTQMCFSADRIVDWLAARRFSGVALPAILGMPGVADRLRLLRFSARIGVGDSLRFLRKHGSVAARITGFYNPAELLEGMGARLDDPELGIEGVHIYTFNSCASTEQWRLRYLEALG